MGEPQIAKPRAVATWGPAPAVLARVRGEHVIVAEPPKPLGGTGVPTPIEYTIAALAACVAALTRRVSRERGLGIESVEVEVEAKVDLRELRGEVPRQERKGIHDVSVTARLKLSEGESIERAREAVEEALSRCPIANALRQVREVSLRVGEA